MKTNDSFPWAILLAVLLAVLAMLFTGCHTIHGVGQDLCDLTSPYVQEGQP